MSCQNASACLVGDGWIGWLVDDDSLAAAAIAVVLIVKYILCLLLSLRVNNSVVPISHNQCNNTHEDLRGHSSGEY